MLSLSYDLHIHSCLSPCGDDESTPANIVGMAYVKGLDVIALTDHNAARNCIAAKEVADAYGITLICGMELTTAEECHVVMLMPTLEKSLRLDEYVRARLSPVKNDPDIFGRQEIRNSDDELIGTEDLLLINATEISFTEAFDLAESLGGVAIPAHVDKSTTSVISNLGFVPPECTFKTAEFKDLGKVESYRRLYPYFQRCKIITSSDAHYLAHINEPVNFIHARERSPEAIIDAIKNPPSLTE